MLTPELESRISALLGGPILSCRPTSGGYTPAIRVVCETVHGSAFVKIGTSEFTVAGLRKEHQNYQLISAPFVPRFIAFEDHETAPILVMEDLSTHHWPPPWTEEHVAQVVAEINALHSLDISDLGVGEFETVFGELPGWSLVAADPTKLLATGLVDEPWLEQALPVLLSATDRCEKEGSALTHCDLRSDNLCIAPEQVFFIDWNWACRWNPRLDLGFFLNALAGEGGPPQETYLPNSAEESAVVSGFFARQAGLPEIPDAPRVRWIQRQQLKSALPWAARMNGLPPPFSA